MAPAYHASLERYDGMLRLFVSMRGVNYEGIRRNAASMTALREYTTAVATMHRSAPLAHWLNAYNALVIQSVLDRFPMRSVKDIKGFFEKIEHRVAGDSYTLDRLESNIRTRFKDPRIHFALNCGARSCPQLLPWAFRQPTLSSSLESLCRMALTTDRHLRVENNELSISEIFFWYQSDFEQTGISLDAWIKRYAPPERLAMIPAGAPLKRMPFDWRLNTVVH